VIEAWKKCRDMFGGTVGNHPWGGRCMERVIVGGMAGGCWKEVPYTKGGVSLRDCHHGEPKSGQGYP